MSFDTERLGFDDAPIEEYLQPVLEATPVPRAADYRENFQLVASEVRVGVSGLRAILVTEKLPAAPASMNGESLNAHVMHMPWGEESQTSHVTVSDRVGLRGNIVQQDEGFTITLPRGANERPGRRIDIARRHSSVLQAMIEQRDAALLSGKTAVA